MTEKLVLLVPVTVWLLLAYAEGGLARRQWVPTTVIVAVSAAAVFGLGLYSRRPGHLSLAVIIPLLGYSCWLLASAGWALSAEHALEEAGRTFFYLGTFGLSLTVLTDPRSRRLMWFLLLAVGLLLVFLAAFGLQGGPLDGVFTGRRFAYPIPHGGASGALYLLLFWPLLWLSAASREAAPLRGLALGLCSSLPQLALLTHSSSVLGALALSGLLTLLLSPVRLRTVFYLLVPAALLIYSYPHLERYWLEGPLMLDGDRAAWDVLTSLLVGTFAGMVLAVLESWVRITGRMRVVFAAIVLTLLLTGLGLGHGRLPDNTLHPADWLSRDAREAWALSWQSFEEHPWRGLGAGSFELSYREARADNPAGAETPEADVAHSLTAAGALPMNVLAGTGIVGMVLLFGALLVAAGGIVWPRADAGLRALIGRPPSRWGSRPKDLGGTMALLAGFSFWLAHAATQGSWRAPGVALGALLLLALALAETDARGPLWPRLARARSSGQKRNPGEPLREHGRE